MFDNILEVASNVCIWPWICMVLEWTPEEAGSTFLCCSVSLHLKRSMGDSGHFPESVFWVIACAGISLVALCPACAIPCVSSHCVQHVPFPVCHLIIKWVEMMSFPSLFFPHCKMTWVLIMNSLPHLPLISSNRATAAIFDPSGYRTNL